MTSDTLFEVKIYHLWNQEQINALPKNVKEQVDGFFPFGLGNYFDFSILVISKGTEILFLETDKMAPEDATFGRDLSWIPQIIKMVYELGKEDGSDDLDFEN